MVLTGFLIINQSRLDEKLLNKLTTEIAIYIVETTDTLQCS